MKTAGLQRLQLARRQRLFLLLPAAAFLVATFCASVDGETEEGWGSFCFYTTVPRVELSLTRHGAEMDTITLPPGTVVTAEDDDGKARVHWMGELFRLAWSDLQSLDPAKPKPAADPPAQDAAPPEPMSLTVGGRTFEQALLKKDFPKSVMIGHREGVCFLDKTDLDPVALRALGLKPPREPGTQLSEPVVGGDGVVRVATRDRWEITPARMVAYLERNPIDAEPRRRLKDVSDCTAIFCRPEKFAEWPIEEAVWYQQSRYRVKMAPWCVNEPPIELLSQFYREQQRDGYWGETHEKAHRVSLREEVQRFGIRATRSGEFASGWHALAYALRYSLAKQGVNATINPLDLKRDELAANPPSPPPKKKGSKGWKRIDLAKPNEIPYTLSKLGIPTAAGRLRCGVTIRDIRLGAVAGNLWARPDYFGSDFNRRNRFSHDLIMHELRMGNPVLAGMCSNTEHRKGNGYMTGRSSGIIADQTVLIVGFYIVRPGPEPRVVYEVLNTWGTEWGDHGFGWMEDTLVAWAVGVEAKL